MLTRRWTERAGREGAGVGEDERDLSLVATHFSWTAELTVDWFLACTLARRAVERRHERFQDTVFWFGGWWPSVPAERP